MWNVILNFITDVLSAFKDFSIKDAFDILLVAIVFYYVIRLMRDTKATQLAKGSIIILILYFIVTVLRLNTMEFILRGALTLGLTAMVVVFQPELRRALEQMGRFSMTELGFGATASEQSIKESEEKIEILTQAVKEMSDKKTGALIVMERTTKLQDIMTTGTIIDASLTKELLLNIFFINSPLHDGAVIMRKFKITAAGCYLPISEDMSISKDLGTRHRAALGMSEGSDALVIVVSEETGYISVALDGNLQRHITKERLRIMLEENLIPKDKEDIKKSRFWRKKTNEQ